MTTPTQERSWIQVFAWPMAIVALTFIGLVAALLGGDGVWRWLGWCCLSVPILVVARPPAQRSAA